MGAILKSHRYRLVDNNDFDLPLPLKFQVYKKDCAIAEYEISETEELTCRILTKYKEDMLTTVYRPIKLSDIYYLLSCRVFQNNTPFTALELSLLGLEKYNVYDILKITRGITPFDNYWIKFEGDDCDYDKALEDFNAATTPKEELPGSEPQEASPDSEGGASVSEILSQHKLDVAKIAAEEVVSAEAPAGNVSDADIDHILHNEGGKMSQGDIEKLLAGAANASEPEPAPEPAPAASSGGMMSQDDIEKLLAGAAGAPEPEPAPAPAPAASGGGKMSQDDIEKLLAGAAGAPEPEPAPEPAPAPAASGGGKMSQDDIEKLLAGAAGTPEPEPAPEPAPASSGSGKMSEDDIAALLQSMQDEANK